MKTYRKPTITVIEFDAKDVVLNSAFAFDIEWLNLFDSENGGNQE